MSRLPADRGELAGAVQLGARWAELLGALALYPDTNLRVAEALARFRGALDLAAALAGGGEVRLLFDGEAARIGGERIALQAGSKLHWLKERFDRSILAGVCLLPGVTDESIVLLSRRLIEHHARRLRPGTGFRELWGRPPRGVELVERRFDGGFAVRAGEEPAGRPVPPIARDELVAALAGDRDVQGVLGSLAERHAGSPGADGVRPIELIEGIAGLLPADVAADPARAVLLTKATLAHLAGAGDGRDDGLLALAERVGRRFFRRAHPSDAQPPALPRRTAGARPGPLASARERRPEDAGLGEDVQGFLVELERLPPGPRRVPPAEVDLRSEQVGVFLHQLAHADEPRALASLEAGLVRLLEEPDARTLALVGGFLRSKDPVSRRGVERLLALVRRRGAGELLRRAGVLDAAWALREFPCEFFDYVAGLDLEDPSARRVLFELCGRIGAEAFRRAATELGRDHRLLERGFLRFVFSDRSGATLPLARLVLARGGERFKEPLVACLREGAADARDRAILDLVRRPTWLSSEYLLLVAEGEQGERLDYQRQAILCRFLRASEEEPGLEAERLRAVELLGELPSLAVARHLQRLLGERRLGLFPRHPGDLRRAARRALQRIAASAEEPLGV